MLGLPDTSPRIELTGADQSDHFQRKHPYPVSTQGQGGTPSSQPFVSASLASETSVFGNAKVFTIPQPGPEPVGSRGLSVYPSPHDADKNDIFGTPLPRQPLTPISIRNLNNSSPVQAVGTQLFGRPSLSLVDQRIAELEAKVERLEVDKKNLQDALRSFL